MAGEGGDTAQIRGGRGGEGAGRGGKGKREGGKVVKTCKSDIVCWV